MEEHLILVDALDHKRGTAPKLLAHQLGLLHRAFSIFIFDAQGRVLMQQRALDKYHSPGLWTNTCCGHPRPGERTANAARRRLREEMGLDCVLHKVSTLLYHEAVSNGLIEHEFDHIFVGFSAADPHANPDEAYAWQWLTAAQLREHVSQAPQTFTVWLRRILEITSPEQWQTWAAIGTGQAQDAYRVPPLHCPPAQNIDEALGDEVNRRLMEWVEEVGIFPDKLAAVRDSHFGRFAMLCHRDTDDPDRILLAAQCIAALFSVDDYYCDDERTGSEPRLVGPRLSLALAAMEPAHLVTPYAGELEQALDRDPVLVALRAWMRRVEQFASPAQVARVRHETIAMFVTMTAEAAWRIEGLSPAIWEYLAQRQINSFLPCMTLIDVIGGYELPANLYSRPDIRRVITLAASATIIANDLYSARKESQAQIGDFNLPSLLMRERGCSLAEAMRLSVDVHDQVVRLYEEAERGLLAEAPPVLLRFFSGVKTWLAGSLEWHRRSGRYHG